VFWNFDREETFQGKWFSYGRKCFCFESVYNLGEGHSWRLNVRHNETSFMYLGGATNQPTPWNRVLLEKLIAIQLVKKFPPFMEPEGPSSCS
jgi:hypothetical protein